MFDKFMETMMPLVESHIKEEKPRRKPSKAEVRAKQLARQAREQSESLSIFDEIED